LINSGAVQKCQVKCRRKKWLFNFLSLSIHFSTLIRFIELEMDTIAIERPQVSLIIFSDYSH